MKPATVEKRHRDLATCTHGDCHSHCIWDFKTCWQHLSPAEQTTLQDRVRQILRTDGNLSGIVLSGANLRGFDFSKANLTKALIDYCDLRECKFIDANLREAYLGWSVLIDADLSRAELHGTVFTHTEMRNVRILAYSFLSGRTPINISASCFGRTGIFQRPKINETPPAVSEHAYRALKAYFASSGDYDSASWASYAERSMQRKDLWLNRRFVNWFASLFFGVTSGYGEKPARVIVFALGVIISYGLAYFLAALLVTVPANSPVLAGWDGLANAAYFSMSTFCTFSAPLLNITDSWFAKALVATEAFLGVFSMGLFIFTLTRRYVAR